MANLLSKPSKTTSTQTFNSEQVEFHSTFLKGLIKL